MGLRDYTVYDFIQRNAQLYPDEDCMVFKETRLSHKEFKGCCDRLAAGLTQVGISKGDRIGIVAHNCDEFMFLYGAAAKIGAIILPVNWRFQAEEVEFVLNDCAPRFVFAGPDFRPMVSQVAPKVKSVERCYTIGGGAVPDGYRPFAELYSDKESKEEIDLPADSGFIIMHTAAVGGRPRGALLSQGNIVSNTLSMMRLFAISTSDCHICSLPLFHIAGVGMAMAAMHAGGKNVIVERFDPEMILRLIEKEKGTLFFSFAPILKTILEKHAEGSYDISSLRCIPGLDHPDTIRQFLKTAPQAKYFNAFGQTEVLSVAGASFEDKPGSAGRPAPLARVVLFDDYDREVPVGTPGEICVRSPGVFLGYWGREEDTAYTFRKGWHHTGDIGRFDEDGYLWYVKRKAEKELIKPGGENVYPAEVEKAILEQGDVAEVAVIGVPDVQWREAVKAICVLKSGRSLDPQALIDFVGTKIARYKKPKHVVFVRSLPKTKEGEIDRDQVKKDYGDK
jgi:acyl-CoA synthetase (AMP-forming)/AMP-acid ligase II